VRPLLAAALVYLAFGLLLLGPTLLGDKVLSASGFWTRLGPFPAELRDAVPRDNAVMGDSAVDFVPWLRWAADRYRADGRIPLWKDTALCGAPFVGNGQSAVFFPTTLAAIVLGAPPWIHAAQALAKLVGGALGAYLLARHLRQSFVAALACGLVFGFGGFQSAWLLFPLTNVSLLLPWLLLATDRAVLNPTLRNAGLLALVAGLQHLGGHPETALHGQSAAVVCALVRCASLRGQAPRARRRLAAVAGGLLAGIAVGAAQILPLLEYLFESEALQTRQQAAAVPWTLDAAWSALFVLSLVVALLTFRSLARPGARVGLAALLLFAAVFAGVSATLHAGIEPNFLRIVAPDWFGSVRRDVGPPNHLEYAGAFVGAALPLAVLGLLAGRPRGVVKLAAALLAVGLLVGFNAPVISELLRTLPLFRLAANQRLQVLALLAAAVLAGFGLDALGGEAGRAVRRRFAAAALLPLLSALLAVVVAVFAGWLTNANRPTWNEGDGAAKVLLLPSGTARALYPLLPPPRPCDEKALTPDDGRLVSGIVALPRPVSGVRLIYGRDDQSIFARSMPLEDVWPGVPVPPELGATKAQLFHAVIPAADVLPEVTQVRVWVSFADGSHETSPLLSAPDDVGPAGLQFPARPATAGGVWQLLGFAAAVLLVLALLAAGPARVVPARLALVLLVAASLYPFVAGLLPSLAPELAYPGSAPIDALRKLAPDGRMLSLSPSLFAAELPTYYGIADVRGYDVLYPQRVATLLDALAASPPSADPDPPAIAPAQASPDAAQDTGRVRAGSWLDLLGLMSVRALAGYWGEAGPLQLHAFALDSDPCARPYVIAMNPRFLPRARLVSGAVVEADDARALRRLYEPDVRTGRSVVLAEGVPRAAGGDPGRAKIVLSRPEQVRVEVAPRAPGWLTLSDTFFPGWRALVDGEPREIVRANLAFRAVAVAPGDELVEFRYEPRWFRVGAVTSLAAAALALLACVLPDRRRAARAQPPA